MVYILSNIQLHFPTNLLSDSLSFDNSEHCTVLNHDIQISSFSELSQEVIPFVSLSFPGNSSLSYLFILLIIPAAILFLALTHRKKRICFEPAKKSAFYLWSPAIRQIRKVKVD